MDLQLNKDNFNQTLARFSTSELETLVEKFPYFQQAHLLLAKKYQQQSNPKFDQQLQLAALYTQDRELLFSIFNEKVTAPTFTQPKAEEIVEPIVLELPVNIEPVVEQKADEVIQHEPSETFELTATQNVNEEVIEATIEEKQVEEILVEQPIEDVSVSEPHTFDEWLQVFSKAESPKVEFKQEEIPVEAEKQDEELEKLYLTNIPVNLQELVEEETHYSKGLDKFIEEQIQKHKTQIVKKTVSENELDAEIVTETMAKVYEMQKKYSKAIRCYEILALKYPEKNDFFAARINYLKNII